MKLQAWKATWWVAKTVKDILYWCAYKFEDLENWADKNCAKHV